MKNLIIYSYSANSNECNDYQFCIADVTKHISFYIESF